ncbi:hypothetical protein [Mesobacterium pallidum]|uniref:hypothetical protein n=1 Tax=Mesobacterium pallidum TaxID=2872037 RepID=UPI001EE1B833|nr:hypothetical protein [Mesobacterium pallidum]
MEEKASTTAVQVSVANVLFARAINMLEPLLGDPDNVITPQSAQVHPSQRFAPDPAAGHGVAVRPEANFAALFGAGWGAAPGDAHDQLIC